MTPPRRLFGLATISLILACGPSGLPKAGNSNGVDTLTLWTLLDGPLQQPTAYALDQGLAGLPVRLYETINFEFAYSLDDARRPVFLPLAVLGLSPGSRLRPGLQKTSLTFDGLTRAPQNGYLTADTIPIAAGEVYVVRSRGVCSSGLPLYGKIEVLYVDTDTVRFRALANLNCWFHSLTLGVPKD